MAFKVCCLTSIILVGCRTYSPKPAPAKICQGATSPACENQSNPTITVGQFELTSNGLTLQSEGSLIITHRPSAHEIKMAIAGKPKGPSDSTLIEAYVDSKLRLRHLESGKVIDAPRSQCLPFALDKHLRLYVSLSFNHIETVLDQKADRFVPTAAGRLCNTGSDLRFDNKSFYGLHGSSNVEVMRYLESLGFRFNMGAGLGIISPPRPKTKLKRSSDPKITESSGPMADLTNTPKLLATKPLAARPAAPQLPAPAPKVPVLPVDLYKNASELWIAGDTPIRQNMVASLFDGLRSGDLGLTKGTRYDVPIKDQGTATLKVSEQLGEGAAGRIFRIDYQIGDQQGAFAVKESSPVDAIISASEGTDIDLTREGILRALEKHSKHDRTDISDQIDLLDEELEIVDPTSVRAKEIEHELEVLNYLAEEIDEFRNYREFVQPNLVPGGTVTAYGGAFRLKPEPIGQSRRTSKRNS